MMKISSVFVCGAGTMGAGIALLCASSGYQVRCYDLNEDILERARQRCERRLDRDVGKGKLTSAEAERTLENILWTTDMEDARDADLVVEAAPEDITLKLEVFRRLDGICPERTILASNTSSLSITELGAATSRPDRVVGIHFFNPVHTMRLVELVSGLLTSERSLRTAESFATSLGKEVTRSRDLPGFVTSRLVAMVVNEGFWMLHENLASKEDIDKAVRLGLNHPMGPLELGDLIGLDVVLAILNRLDTGFGDPKYRPCPLLVQYVQAGRLGRKSGQGVHDYR